MVRYGVKWSLSKPLIIYTVIKNFKGADRYSPLTITGVPCTFVVIPDLIQIQA
jgi:hypothetical protein